MIAAGSARWLEPALWELGSTGSRTRCTKMTPQDFLSMIRQEREYCWENHKSKEGEETPKEILKTNSSTNLLLHPPSSSCRFCCDTVKHMHFATPPCSPVGSIFVLRSHNTKTHAQLGHPRAFPGSSLSQSRALHDSIPVAGGGVTQCPPPPGAGSAASLLRLQ